MCLTPNTKGTKRRINQWKKDGTKSITIYKAVVMNVSKQLESPLYVGHIWKPGKHKANDCSKYENIGYNTIFEGFHGYTTKSKAKASFPFNIIIKLTAKTKHFLGSNGYEIAFSEVYLTKKEYNRAIKEKV